MMKIINSEDPIVTSVDFNMVLGIDWSEITDKPVKDLGSQIDVAYKDDKTIVLIRNPDREIIEAAVSNEILSDEAIRKWHSKWANSKLNKV